MKRRNYKHAACSGNDHYYADRMWQSGKETEKQIRWQLYCQVS